MRKFRFTWGMDKQKVLFFESKRKAEAYADWVKSYMGTNLTVRDCV